MNYRNLIIILLALSSVTVLNAQEQNDNLYATLSTDILRNTATDGFILQISAPKGFAVSDFQNVWGNDTMPFYLGSVSSQPYGYVGFRGYLYDRLDDFPVEFTEKPAFNLIDISRTRLSKTQTKYQDKLAPSFQLKF